MSHILEQRLTKTSAGFTFGRLDVERWQYKADGYGVEVNTPGVSVAVMIQKDDRGILVPVVEVNGTVIDLQQLSQASPSRPPQS